MEAATALSVALDASARSDLSSPISRYILIVLVTPAARRMMLRLAKSLATGPQEISSTGGFPLLLICVGRMIRWPISGSSPTSDLDQKRSRVYGVRRSDLEVQMRRGIPPDVPAASCQPNQSSRHDELSLL